MTFNEVCHHLPEKAGNHFSHIFTLYSTRSWLMQLPGSLEMASNDVPVIGLDDVEVLKHQIEGVVELLDDAARVMQPLRDESDVVDEGWRYRFESGRVPVDLTEVANQLSAGFVRIQSATQMYSAN